MAWKLELKEADTFVISWKFPHSYREPEINHFWLIGYPTINKLVYASQKILLYPTFLENLH